ncbi:MAG: transcriptional repressor [Acidimicrobiia bacterium]|nr:transcriptional repressor [Acidimicrobiia bacterium]
MTPNLDSQITERLALDGLRFTRGRREVVEALLASDGPMSANELSDVLGDGVPLSSIYRSLAILTDAHILTVHLATKGLARYELSEWLVGHHHHLVCTECGSVEDIHVSASHEERLREVVDAVASVASFIPSSHALEIDGRCAQCQ